MPPARTKAHTSNRQNPSNVYGPILLRIVLAEAQVLGNFFLKSIEHLSGLLGADFNQISSVLARVEAENLKR